MSAVQSTDDIRRAFPALERRHEGRSVAYFDGPGGTQVPRAVVEAMADYLVHHNANTHWRFPTSVETDAALAAARAAVADFLNATPAEVAFGQNMTSLTFHLARALARDWREGDEVIVTELDHHANVDPWRALTRDRGILVRTARVDPASAGIDWPHLESLFTPRTRLLAIGAASNAVGTVNDVARAAALAHDRGALLFVDAVHYAPHALVDVRAIDCDFLACSAYKFYGPHVGVLYGKRPLLEALDVPKLAPAPDAAPERLETGTQNHEGIVGTAAAIDVLAGFAGEAGTRRDALARTFDALHVRSRGLVERLWSGLTAMPGVTVYGPPPDAPRTPTIACAVRGLPADEVAERLTPHGLFVSSGDFYATTLVERLGHGTDGLVRIGCACYTTEDEVTRLLDAMRTLV
ncbi:MAG: cysteine desulfurase-like protein [Vicinamibacteraceae bacterium]|nr:cysteine desulfurase-like protein [Vicinamibacteraceae bacterium]